MIGGLMKAARGGRNVAAQGAVSLKGLRGGNSRAVKATIGASAIGGASLIIPASKPTGNMAGFVGGTSSYIEQLGTGYGNMIKPSIAANFGRAESYVPTAQQMSRIHKSDIRPSRYNPFQADKQMSKLIR